jgi:asparagine synthase (glutamine-hydrolysing)
MANSVEARVPFLDPGLVEFVYRLPVSQKLANGRSKVVLKEAISDIVPEWVVNRRKQGFGAPVEAWLQSGLGALFERLIETDSVRSYFRQDVLRAALHRTRSGRGGSRMFLWPIINFALWHTHWIEGGSIDDFVQVDQLVA